MRIRLTRTANDRHRLELERDDGSRAEREFETRSVLLHDLVHFAVESEAGISDGFWGRLAAGADFDELIQDVSPGGRLAESLVAPMQSVWKQRLPLDRYLELAAEHAPFVDRPFAERVLERIRRLEGHWRATPFHGTLELTWPAEPG